MEVLRQFQRKITSLCATLRSPSAKEPKDETKWKSPLHDETDHLISNFLNLALVFVADFTYVFIFHAAPFFR